MLKTARYEIGTVLCWLTTSGFGFPHFFVIGCFFVIRH